MATTTKKKEDKADDVLFLVINHGDKEAWIFETLEAAMEGLIPDDFEDRSSVVKVKVLESYELEEREPEIVTVPWYGL